jgi:hypothetical protein
MNLLCEARSEALQHLADRVQGKALWQDTLLFTRDDFLGTYSVADLDLARKARIYHVGGASLGSLLEKRNCHGLDFIRATIALFAELDQFAGLHPLPGPVHASHLVVRKEKNRRPVLSRAPQDFNHLALSHMSFVPSHMDAAAMFLELLMLLYPRVEQELARLKTFATEAGLHIYEDTSAAKDLIGKLDSKARKLLTGMQRDLDAVARAKVYRELDGIMESLAVFE